MAKMTTDQIGQLSERLADVALLLSVGRPYHRPLFRTVLLGDKYPTADILVDTLGSDGTVTGHFFRSGERNHSRFPDRPPESQLMSK